MKLSDLSLTRLSAIYRRATGETLEKCSSKKAAVAAVSDLPKKRIVAPPSDQARFLNLQGWTSRG
jgi:hypothetical protein